jgi:hypothetical protein
MEPPAERIFGSREQLIKAAREHAIQRGYVVTIVRSTAQKNVYLGCDRGGFYHDRVNAPEGAKRRLTNTRRINCPFMLFGRRVSGDRWELKVKNPCHNHSTENTMIGHPSARRLTEEQLNEVLRLSEIGLAPRDVLAVTRKQYPEALVSSRDIYNARSALRRQKLGNSTPLEYLQKTLQENSWKYAFKQIVTRENNRALLGASSSKLDFLDAHEAARNVVQENPMRLTTCVALLLDQRTGTS